MPDPASLPHPVPFLTGAWPGWNGAAMPDGPRPPWPKFSPQGDVLPFPGVTIVCHVTRDSPTFAALVDIQAALKAEAFARHFAYLPPSSFHMTLFDLSNETRRGTSAWPKGIAPDAAWPAVSDQLAHRLDGMRLPRFAPSATALFGGFSLIVEGHGGAAEHSMRRARDQLRAASQIFRDDHDSYVFHVTLAYPLRFLSEDEANQVSARCQSLFEAYESALAPLSLGPAELCDFKDMHAFTPRLTF